MVYLKLEIPGSLSSSEDAYLLIGEHRLIVSLTKKYSFELNELKKIEIVLDGFTGESRNFLSSVHFKSGKENIIKIYSSKMEPITLQVKIKDVKEYHRLLYFIKYWRKNIIEVIHINKPLK